MPHALALTSALIKQRFKPVEDMEGLAGGRIRIECSSFYDSSRDDSSQKLHLKANVAMT